MSFFVGNNFVLDSTALSCVERFNGNFINDDNSEALIFFYTSTTDEYLTKQGDATVYEKISYYHCAVRGFRYSAHNYVWVYEYKF